MRKQLFRMAGVLLVLLIVIELTTCSVQSKAERGEGYKQNDFIFYQLVTDNDIKKVPRISNDYFFKYQARDGSAPEQSTIIFREASDPSSLKSYITTLGYHFAGEEGDSEHWEKIVQRYPVSISGSTENRMKLVFRKRLIEQG